MSWVCLVPMDTVWWKLEKEQWPDGGVPPDHPIREVWSWVQSHIMEIAPWEPPNRWPKLPFGPLIEMGRELYPVERFHGPIEWIRHKFEVEE